MSSNSWEDDDAADWGVEVEGVPLGPRENERTARGVWSAGEFAFGADLSSDIEGMGPCGQEMNFTKLKSRSKEDNREEDHSPSSLGAVDKDKQGGTMGHASAMAFPGSIHPMILRVSKAPCFTSVVNSLFEGSPPTIQKRLQHNSSNISRTPSPSRPCAGKTLR